MGRKSPIEHKVCSHRRKGSSVDSYSRGNGKNPHIGPIHDLKIRQFKVFPYENQDNYILVEAQTREEAIEKVSVHPDYVGLPKENFGTLIVNIPPPKPKHFVVKYRATFRNGKTGVDTISVFSIDRGDIISNILKNSYGHIPKNKQPKIQLIKASLQVPVRPRLEALLDIDNRTKSRLKRGYVLDYVKISDIDLPPITKKIRFDDNFKKIKATRGMPPVHLFLKTNGRFGISDGVHRIHSAKQLGYDKVPILIKYGED